MDRSSLIFCLLSLIITLGLSWAFIPMASVSTEKLNAWKVPTEAEELGDIDLGDFGVVSISELMSYYIENPPPPPEAGAKPAREVRFQGC